jgi:hypothetical protein
LKTLNRLSVLWAATAFTAMAAAGSAENPPYSSVAPDGARMIDLAEIPAGAELIRQLLLGFRDRALETAFDEQMRKALSDVGQLVPARGGGYLIEVEIFTSENGDVVVSGGQFFRAIGPGSEPLDALAESLRRGSYLNAPPGTNFSDERSFIWITSAPPRTRAGTISGPFASTLRDAARAEMRRRNLLAAWESGAGSELPSVAERAQFWAEVVASRAAQLADDARRKRADELTAVLQKSGREFEEAYALEKRLEREIEERSERLAFLDKVDAVLSLISKGIEAHGLTCNGKQVTEARSSVEIRTQLTLENKNANSVLDRIRSTVKIKADNIERADLQLEQFYNENQIAIPKRDPIILP